jgi:RsiW-degrading membrane proteinase PrsW (M82 family)
VVSENPAVVVLHPHHRHGWWWKTLLAGIVLWVLTIVVTGATSNVNLVPTLILLGSFLVPFCVVLFVVERVSGSVSTLQVVLLFFIGGVCGVLGASLLEANLHANLSLYIAVGFIEELVKGIILLIGSRRVVPRTRAQGALLGATVGAGFAAFESAGYAFNAAITTQGIDLVSLLQTEALRAILTPVGHVVWTAILGAAIFGVAQSRHRVRAVIGVVVAFIGVALLHALWDSMSGIASLLALVFTGNAMVVLENGFLPPSAAAAVSSLATILYIAGIAVAAAIGILVIWLLLRRRASTPAQPVQAGAPVDPAAVSLHVPTDVS